MRFRNRLALPAAAALALAAVIGALWLAAPAEAQRRSVGSLRVVVTDAEGQPVPGARLTVQASHGAEPRAVETGKDGGYLFRLPRGHYDLRAYSDGLWSQWRRNVPVRTGRRTDVRLRLEATAEPQEQ
jgi:hypothetical protein